jgi:hypothetical protein
MKTIKHSVVLLVTIFCVASLHAQDYYKNILNDAIEKAPKKNISILSPTSDDELSKSYKLFDVTISKVANQPFSQIFVAKVPTPLEKYWNSRIRWVNKDTVKANTEFEIVFNARYIRLGDEASLINVAFKDIVDKNNVLTLGYFNVSVTSEWKQYRFKVKKNGNAIAPQNLEVSFIFGRKSQDVEVGGIAIISSVDK